MPSIQSELTKGSVGVLLYAFYACHTYTLLTLKYGVNLLNALVSNVLHQNARTIFTAQGSVQTPIPIALLTHILLPQIISYSDT